MQALICYLVPSCPSKTVSLPLNFPRFFPSCVNFVGGNAFASRRNGGHVKRTSSGWELMILPVINYFRMTPQKSVFSNWSLSAGTSTPSESSEWVFLQDRKRVFFIEILLRSLQIMQFKKLIQRDSIQTLSSLKILSPYVPCGYIEMWLLCVDLVSCDVPELHYWFYFFCVDSLGFST